MTVNLSANGKSITINYAHGRYQLQQIEVQSGGQTIASKQVSTDGAWTLDSKDLESAQPGTITAVVTDTGYYTASGTANYNR